MVEFKYIVTLWGCTVAGKVKADVGCLCGYDVCEKGTFCYRKGGCHKTKGSISIFNTNERKKLFYQTYLLSYILARKR